MNELSLILNLKNTSINHKEKCQENCNVSLFELREAARYINECLNSKGLTEQYKEGLKLIEKMPVI